VLAEGTSVASLYGSTRNADDFNVANHVYAMSQPAHSYIDPSLTAAAMQ
jgi:NitT/TauT family transport system substrate-binding protein